MAIITSGPGTLYISTTNTSSTWTNWNQSWYQIGTTSGSSTWIQWNTAYTSTGGLYTAYTPAEPESDEVLEQRRREQAEATERCRVQAEESRRLVEEAGRHAEELLLALLSDEQAETWREHRWFAVRGSQTGRTYHIRRGIAGNVDLMAEHTDAREVTYCAHPPGVPAEDVCLAQMLLLATDEDAFLRVANVQQRYTIRIPDAEVQRHLRAVA